MKLNGDTTRSLIAALSVGAFLTACAPSARAQSPGAASAPAVGRLSDTAIAQFKANPQSLLTTYASAGLPLSTEVRGLILTDPTLVDALIDLAGGANDAQKGAIGAGLAEAARILGAGDPAEAARIRKAVAGSGLAPLITAFMALADSPVFAATEGGGASAGSGGPVGGVGVAAGAGGGGSSGGFSFGQANGASPFGSIGGAGAPGGGLTSSTSQSVSPSKSSI